MQDTFTCSECLTAKPGGTGYAVAEDDRKICYECCAELDKKNMREHKRSLLYLVQNPDATLDVTNWPGTLRLRVTMKREGRHNIAGKRIDVWFRFNGYWWHGVQYGSMTQLCHCKQTREAA